MGSREVLKGATKSGESEEKRRFAERCGEGMRRKVEGLAPGKETTLAPLPRSVIPSLLKDNWIDGLCSPASSLPSTWPSTAIKPVLAAVESRSILCLRHHSQAAKRPKSPINTKTSATTVGWATTLPL